MSRTALAALIAVLCAAGVALAAAAAPQEAATGRWTALAPSKLARTEVAAARIGRHIYVVGGFNERSGQTTAAVERYDIRRDRWSRVPAMPVALNHPAAATHRGWLYVHGGYTAPAGLAEPSPALLRYDPGRRRWRRLPSAPTPRAAHAFAALGGRLYAAGGANDSGSLRSLEIYDIARRRWRAGPDFPFGPARNHTTGVTSGGRFYVIAGRDAGNFTAVERYDPRRRRWENVADVATARGGIAAVRITGGRIVLFGGEDLGPGGRTIAPAEIYSPRADRWRSLPAMRTPRHGLGGAALGRRVFAIQGGVTPGLSFSRAIEMLDVR